MKKKRNSNFDRNTKYWATLPLEDLLPIIMELVDDYFEGLVSSGRMRLLQDCYNVYYGLSESSNSHEASKVSFVGDNEEFIKVKSGHMANIMQHILISATGSDPNFIPRAINNDYRSKAQTYAAKSILEYLMKEEDYGSEYRSAAEMSLIFGDGYIYQGWDAIDDDLFVQAHSPLTIVSDLSNRNPRRQQWYIVIERVNKWDIVAKYNVSEDDVSELVDDEERTGKYWVGFEDIFDGDSDSDYINVYHLYHKKSPAIPNGRYVACVNSTISIYPNSDKDDRLPYKELPIYRISPRDMISSPYGYSTSFDIIAHDILHNIALSTIHTNLNKYGRKWLVGPKGMSYENIGSMDTITVPSEERAPAILDFTEISNTLFQVLETEQKQMEILSGINSAIRGDTEGQKSGSHAALLHSAAVQYQSGFHQSYNRLLQRCGTGILRLIKEFSTGTKMIEIVGADGEAYLREFSKEDISDIDRVLVENGNPILNTVAGKLHLADTMLERGIIKSSDQYQDVLDTGQVQGILTEGRNKNSGIQSENEMLMKPEELSISNVNLTAYDGTIHTVEVINEVRVIMVENHHDHIFGHYPILLNPANKNNLDLLKKTLIHIAEHIWCSRWGSRDILIATGQQPFPIDTTGQQPPQAQQGPIKQLGPNIPTSPKQNPGGPLGDVPDENQPLPGMPGMPQNPATMEQGL